MLRRHLACLIDSDLFIYRSFLADVCSLLGPVNEPQQNYDHEQKSNLKNVLQMSHNHRNKATRRAL